MTAPDYLPSPVAMVRDQVSAFESSGGMDGGTHKGLPIIIVSTIGARTGAVRKTPLMRVEDGGRYALVATFGGSPAHPMWFHNIEHDPEVTIQDGPVAHPYRARVLGSADPELEAWWARAVQVFPAYGEYRDQLRGVRDVPLVVAEPLSGLGRA